MAQTTSPNMEKWFRGTADTLGGEKVQAGNIICLSTRERAHYVVEVVSLNRDERFGFRGYRTVGLTGTVRSLETGETQQLRYSDFFDATVLASDKSSYQRDIEAGKHEQAHVVSPVRVHEQDEEEHSFGYEH